MALRPRNADGPFRDGRAGRDHRLGDISEEQWEVFKLAFMTTGRVAVLSDQQGEGWMYDYRFVEAVR